MAAPPPEVAPSGAAAPACPDCPIVRSRDLFRNRREVLIVHRDEIYRLRITRADKLILTK